MHRTRSGRPVRGRSCAIVLPQRSGSVLDEAGFVRKDRYDELELKVAQLEHRLRLLEEARPPGAERPA